MLLSVEHFMYLAPDDEANSSSTEQTGSSTTSSDVNNGGSDTDHTPSADSLPMGKSVGEFYGE